MAMSAARGAATVQLPLGQLALVGLGFLCVSNPDKFFLSLARGAQFLQNPAPSGPGQHAPSQPIIIHQSAPASGDGTKGYVVRLMVGAGLCWGSYVVLITILPESAKELLPVNKRVFNQAITSLGKAVINLKDTLMEQINMLGLKQDELGEKQDKTHIEVLEVKGNVQNVRGDISAVQEALTLCQASLSESERRTNYIARGVQLLTRGVSTILPDDEHLLDELVQFNMAGQEFSGSAPLQNKRLQQVRSNLRRQSTGGSSSTDQGNQNQVQPVTPMKYADVQASLVSSYGHDSPVITRIDSEDPENDHPIKVIATPAPVENSVAGIHTLLKLHSVGAPRRSCV